MNQLYNRPNIYCKKSEMYFKRAVITGGMSGGIGKKYLIAGAALLAFGVLPAQGAEPITLGLHGYEVANFGYVANYGQNSAASPAATKLAKFHEQDEGTLSIFGKTTLDNGINVAVQSDFYAYAGTQGRSVNSACGRAASAFTAAPTASACAGNEFIKRVYVTVGTKAGSVILGEREDAAYIIHSSAPDVSPFQSVGDSYYSWWVIAPGNHRGLTLDNTSRYDDRGNKITYISPSFHGLSAAFTYVQSVSTSAGSGSTAPASSSDNSTYVGNGVINGSNYGGDAYAGGLAFADTLGGVAIKADSSILQTSFASMRVFSQGLQVAYGGFTLGGSSFIRDVPSDATFNGNDTSAAVARTLVTNGLAADGSSPASFAQAAAYAGNLYTVGISYTTGPYSASLGFMHDNSKSIKALNGTGKADNTDVYQVGVAYAAGPGVTFRVGAVYADYRGSVANSATPWNNVSSGIAGVSGIKLDF